MKTIIEQRKVRDSQEFKDFIVANHKLGSKKCADLARDKFDIPISQSYVSKLTLKWGLRERIQRPYKHHKQACYVQTHEEYEVLSLPRDFISNLLKG